MPSDQNDEIVDWTDQTEEGRPAIMQLKNYHVKKNHYFRRLYGQVRESMESGDNLNAAASWEVATLKYQYHRLYLTSIGSLIWAIEAVITICKSPSIMPYLWKGWSWLYL